jgi:hypothetical protein
LRKRRRKEGRRRGMGITEFVEIIYGEIQFQETQ